MGQYARGSYGKKQTNKPFFITQNSIMLDLLEKIKLVAGTNASVLITGENGTGKEVLARLLNYHCNRPRGKMVTINCGAIPTDLVESELFGHEKGAFTGANQKKEGCFELADNGTLFLDEVGEMPLDVQVKLLRAVELGSFRRVGGKEEIQVDLRLISATNKVLLDQVKSGSFREDLYYRLNVVELYVPPLRHRKDDISLLTDYFLNHFTACYDIEKVGIDEECMDLFMEYDWPGNVRELRNVIERAVVFSGGRLITTDMLPASIRKNQMPKTSLGPAAGYEHEDMVQIPIGMSLEEIERRVIERTLSSVDNNKTKAAKILGFARKTLHNKLDKYKELD
ncbi:MAG TPA: sigma-54 dependent transcriptional regulator [Balneolaceae bacterium]|nr:sigma-54 dependent transcriptional regulator [Balneolaceae bacterium]